MKEKLMKYTATMRKSNKIVFSAVLNIILSNIFYLKCESAKSRYSSVRNYIAQLLAATNLSPLFIDRNHCVTKSEKIELNKAKNAIRKKVETTNRSN